MISDYINKMKILHCVSSLQVGGAEKLVKNLSVAQQESGQNVAILSFGKTTDEFQKVLSQSKVKVHNIAGNLLKRQIQIIKLINQFDAIHIHSPAVIRAFLLVFPFLLLKKVIYTIHGEVSPNLQGIKVSHRVARCYVNHTFAVSDKTRLKAGELFSWPKDKIKVIKNGVSLPLKSIDKTDQPKLTLGTVSRLIPLKKIEDLVKCIGEFNLHDQVDLKIFGDGPEREKLETLVNHLNLNNTIQFMNNVIDEALIYTLIDCLIICSETEGLPMVLLEGMAYGIPCISTRVGAIPDIIEASDCGFLFDTSNLAQLAEHIKVVSQNKSVLAAKGLNGKKYITKHFAIESIANIYQEYYENLNAQ
jgi:glycosyltransferase involved in cell wall biosynthesis